MYTVLFENEYRKQYCADYYFEELSDAKEYLINKRYVENNRTYFKGNTKAYIQPLKKFK